MKVFLGSLRWDVLYLKWPHTPVTDHGHLYSVTPISEAPVTSGINGNGSIRLQDVYHLKLQNIKLMLDRRVNIIAMYITKLIQPHQDIS
jgi:hypothetical protein